MRAKRRREGALAKRPVGQPADPEHGGLHLLDERVILIEVSRFGVEAPAIEQRVRVVSRGDLEAEQQSSAMTQRGDLRALLAADGEENDRFLQEDPRSRDVRARAARLLARMSKRLGL